MKRAILALVLIVLAALAPLAWATGTVTGFVVSVNVQTRQVTIVPPGWQIPMQLPPPVIVEEPVADELLWALEHDTPPRLITIEELDDDGVYDSWSYTNP